MSARHRKDLPPDSMSHSYAHRIWRGLPRPAHRKPGPATGPYITIHAPVPPLSYEKRGGPHPGLGTLSPETWAALRRARAERRAERWTL